MKSATHDPAESPVGRLAKDIDHFVQWRLNHDRHVTPQEVLLVMMRLTAGFAAHLDAPVDGSAEIFAQFIAEERSARGKT